MARFRSQTILINLTGQALEGIFGSQPGVRYELQHPSPSNGDEWRAVVDEIRPVLKQWVDQWGARGANAVVFYQSHSLSNHLCSVPAPSRGEAAAAAQLACVGSINYPMDEAVLDADFIGQDRSGEGRQWHFVSAADRVTETATLARAIEAAGLTLEQLIPMESAVRAVMTHEALQDSTAHLVGRLYISEDRSFFLVSQNGRIRFVRHMGFTLHQLTTALTRPILLPGEDRDAVQWDFETARAMLFRFGIPGPETCVDEQQRITGRQLMPLMQPVLQRLFIELKQTMRFGLDESSAESMQVRLCGAGAAVDHLDTVISKALDVSVEPDVDYRNFNPGEVAGPGSDFGLVRAETALRPEINLLPRQWIHRQVVRRFKSALWIGLAAAVALMVGDMLRLDRELQQVEAEYARVESRFTEREDLSQKRTWILTGRSAMTSLENRIAAHVGFAVDWSAILRELARVTPRSTRILSVAGRATEIPEPAQNGEINEPACRIRIEGIASAQVGHEVLKNFVDGLRGSPLFAGVNLEDVRKDELDGRAVEKFVITVEVYPMPELPTGVASATSEGESP